MQALNFAPGIGARIPQALFARLEFIDRLDLSRAQARMEVDFPGTSASFGDVSREVKRFLALAALERNPGHRIVIGEKIDGLWHYFILHTMEYRQFCNKAFGSYLHHVPILPEEKPELAADYAKTRELYRKYFGEPPVTLWGDGDMICWGGCDEVTDEQRAQH